MPNPNPASTSKVINLPTEPPESRDPLKTAGKGRCPNLVPGRRRCKGYATLVPMDLKAIEKDWKTRGFSFGLWIDPPGKRWEDYVHDSDELWMLVEGTMELKVGKETHHP